MNAADARARLVANYSPDGLIARLDTMLADLPQPPSPHDLAPMDQFHTGGLAASSTIADLLDLPRGARLLDLGSGLGGPARFFNATCGLVVHGVDLSPAFVEAARYLTERARSVDVSFEVGDVSALTLDDAAFDGAVMLHVAMNVRDREALYRGVARVLKPGAPFVTYDIVSLGGEPDYPAPWASTADLSFLRDPDDTLASLRDAGFRIVSSEVDAERAAASFAGFDPATVPPLARLLGAPDFGLRVKHLRESLLDGRTAVLTAKAVR